MTERSRAKPWSDKYKEAVDALVGAAERFGMLRGSSSGQILDLKKGDVLTEDEVRDEYKEARRKLNRVVDEGLRKCRENRVRV